MAKSTRAVTRRIIVLVFLISYLLIQPAIAALMGEVTEFGYYKVKIDPKRYRNIASTSGYVKEGGEVVLEESTERVPLKIGRLFGFKFRISGFENKRSVQLKLVVTHPEITRPNGSTSTGYSYPVAFDVKDGVIENESGYSIDHEYEMVEGEWRFEYWYYKQKLVTKTFATYVDNGADEVDPQNESTDTKSLDAGDSAQNPVQNQSSTSDKNNSKI